MMGANDASQRDQFQYSFGSFRYNLSSAQNGIGSYAFSGNMPAVAQYTGKL